MATTTLIAGELVPCVDDYFAPGYGLGVVIMKRRTWVNDTSTDPKGVSPIKQDKFYFLSRRKPVFTDTKGETVYAETTPVLTLGSNIIAPAGDVDHGPPELQETVTIKLGEEMLLVRYAVEQPAPTP